MRSLARVLAVTTSSLLLVGALPGQSFAAGGPAFVSGVPAAGSRIKADPATISATFDAALGLTSTLNVTGPGAITCLQGLPSGTTISCTVTTPNLTEGLYTVSYSATGGGLGAGTTTGSFTFTLDKTPPAAPTALAITPDPYKASDLAGSTSITVSGKAEANSAVSVALTGATTVSTTANGSGDFLATFPSTIADGTLTASVTATDAAGNTGAAATKTSVKDTVLPTLASTVPGSGGSERSLTGGTPTPYDAVASENLGGTSAVRIYDGTDQVATTGSVSAKTVRATPTNPLAQGSYTAQIDLVDLAGNPAGTITRPFTVDNTKPGAPVLATPATINKANRSAYTLTGTGEAGATVSLTIGGTVTGSTVVDGAGAWSKTLDVSSLADGSVAISATQTDVASNVSDPATATTTKDVVVPRVTAQAFNKAQYAAADPTATVSGKVDNGTTTAGEADGYTVSVDDAGNPASAPVVVTGTAAGDGTFTSPSIDLTTLGDGTLTATVSATDTAANPSADVTTTASKDTGLPVQPTVSITNPINNANKAAVVVSGHTEAGAAISISISDTALTAPVTRTTTADGSGNYSVPAIDVTTLQDGVLTASVVARDSFQNPSAAGTATANKDVVAPTAPTLVVPPTTNAAQASAVAVSGTGEAAATLQLSATDGTAVITKSVAIAGDGTWSTTLDLHTLADGTITVTANATDTAGNTSTNATGTTAKDTLAPGTPATLTASPSPYTKAHVADDVVVSGTTAAPDSSATGLLADITIADTDAGTADVVKTGVAVASGAFSSTVTAASMATLTDGTLTITAVLRDAAGNTSGPKTATLLKDTTALAVVSTSPSGTSASAPATVSGTYNEVLNQGTSTVVVTKVSNGNVIGGSTTFSSDGKTITFTPGSAFSESTYSVVIHGVDNNDAADTKDASFSFTVDNTPPTAPVVTTPAPAIVPGNQAAYGVSGTGEAGATVTASLTSGVTVTKTAVVAGDGSWSLTVDVTSLSDGTVTISATQADAATNVSIASTPVTTTKDTTGATVTGLAGTSTNAATPSTSITGTTEATATVALSAADGVHPGVTGNATVDGAGHVTGSLNLSSLNDGTVTITATATDAFGNAGAPATTTVSKDSVAPTVSGLAATAVNSTMPSTTVTGSTSSGSDTVALSATDGTTTVNGTATVGGNGSFTGSLNLSTLSDGTITVSATATDTAGNVGPAATTQLTKDAAVPAISGLTATATNTATPSTSITGTTDGTATVALSAADGVHTAVTGTGTVSSGGALTGSLDLSSLNDGSITISATVTDPAGNTATSTTSTTKDTVAPVVTGLTASATNVATTSSTITGSVSQVGSITISATSGGAPVTKTISVPAGAFSTTLDLGSLADGTVTVSATGTDPAGNAGATATTTTTKNTVVPSTPAAPTATAGDRLASVAFTAVSGQSYRVTSSPGAFTTTGTTSPLTVTGLTNGTSYTFTTTTTNSAGNTSVASPSSSAVTPKGHSTTVLNATPSSLRSGTVFTVSGKVTRLNSAGAFGSVILRITFDNGAVSNLGAVTPAANGTFSKNVRAVYNGTYRATYGGDAATLGSTSPGRRTLASAAITASYTARTAATAILVVKGSVAPIKRGAVLYLNEVLSNGSTRLLARQTLPSSSAFSFSLKLPRGSHRLQLFLKATQGNAPGASTFSVTRT